MSLLKIIFSILKSIDVKTFQEINSVIKNGYSKPDESDFDEDYKDSLFINTSANAFIFGGYKHGVIRFQFQQIILKLYPKARSFWSYQTSIAQTKTV